jgi:hypothetical protein
MSNQTTKTSPAIIAVTVWMAINAAFFALMLTSDAMDANNSIVLVLMIISIITLLRSSKIGYGIAVFTLIYAFTFNAFNLTYFAEYLPFTALIINALSAILNATAFIYLFKYVTKKIGMALSIFALIYVFSFNAFNVIYYSPVLSFAELLINLTSIIFTAAAFIYLLKTVLQNSHP